MKKKPESPTPVVPTQPIIATRTAQETRRALGLAVRGFYDRQEMRIQIAGRTKNTAQPIQLHAEDVKRFAERAFTLELEEKVALWDVEDILNSIPFYKAVMTDKERFKGMGPTLSAVILSEFDIEKCDTVSKMWAFAGLRPMPAVRCKVCHTVCEPGKTDGSDFEHPKNIKGLDCSRAGGYVLSSGVYQSGKTQRPEKGVKLPYNAWLRSKLVGVLADCLLRANSPYRSAYDGYKHRKQVANWGRSDGHRDRAARRFMVKMFLQDIWREWRTFEKLPVRPPYAEEKLHMPMHGGWVAEAALNPRVVKPRKNAKKAKDAELERSHE